jgi:hypothetical protein
MHANCRPAPGLVPFNHVRRSKNHSSTKEQKMRHLMLFGVAVMLLVGPYAMADNQDMGKRYIKCKFNNDCYAEAAIGFGHQDNQQQEPLLDYLRIHCDCGYRYLGDVLVKDTGDDIRLIGARGADAPSIKLPLDALNSDCDDTQAKLKIGDSFSSGSCKIEKAYW